MSQLQQNRLPERFYDEPFALCFSGQGFDWISSLREALADGARDRANEVAAAAARILKPVAGQIAAARPAFSCRKLPICTRWKRAGWTAARRRGLSGIRRAYSGVI